MQIDDSTVDRIAKLSKLEFNDEEKKEIRSDLNKMLGLIDKLNEIDTDGVEPLIYITEEENRYRQDEVVETISQKEALKNAPQHDSDYFKVPKVLNGK